ncbi:YkvA family protein [Dyadobacter flavalbus]|nr:YkvA family protein [Dyadobacter flavalbus]
MSNESMIARVLKSIFFKKAQGKASRYATNSAKMFELAKEVISKMQKVGFRENMSDFQTNVQLLIRMIRAYASGEYKGLPWKSILSIVAVLIYFVSPIDLIPDFLPVIGITDDVALIVWLVKTFGSDIQKFSEWEKRKKTINIG